MNQVKNIGNAIRTWAHGYATRKISACYDFHLRKFTTSRRKHGDPACDQERKSGAEHPRSCLRSFHSGSLHPFFCPVLCLVLESATAVPARRILSFIFGWAVKHSNFFGNIAGVLAPLITGFLISSTGSYFPGFVLAAVALVLGAGSYGFIVGELRPPSKAGPVNA
jgi:hypothetical protein